MAEADRKSSTTAEPASQQKPVVKSVSIGIEQGQVVRTFQSRAVELGVQLAGRVKADAIRTRTLGIRILSIVGELVRRGRKRRRPARDHVEAVCRELWPDDGKPPETISDKKALGVLNEELDRRFGKEFLRHDPDGDRDPTTLRRAMGRRPD
jgi:hypothetical protein